MESIQLRTRKFNRNKSKNSVHSLHLQQKYAIDYKTPRYSKRSMRTVFKPVNKVPFKTTILSVYRNQMKNIKQCVYEEDVPVESEVKNVVWHEYED